MSAIPHQFSDAEESGDENTLVTLHKFEQEEGEEWDEDDLEDDEDVFDWETMGVAGSGAGGDFTKKYKAAMTGSVRNPTTSAPNPPSNTISGHKAESLDAHFARRVFLGDIRDLKSLSGADVSHAAAQSAAQSEKRADLNRRTEVDRANRATTEQVLDPRTRLMLYKLLQKSWLQNIHGCVSTGKEANVYYALAGENSPSGEGSELAIKIFKTSILVFKDRDRYVTGEYRFRRGYNRHNPRKMVRMWAEKELRNLHRLVAANIPCPKPYLVKNHVLIMEFIGEDGWPAPRLKDSEFDDETRDRLYLEMVRMMRRMYHVCKLVHADLSEYNLLYHRGEIVVIDVSQSVEHDHPHALDFLRSDCDNITDYFGKCGIRNPLTTRQLFDFVTDIQLSETAADNWINETLSQTIHDDPTDASAQEQIDAAVFRQAHIPRTLYDVQFFERHAKRANQGDTSNVFYQTVTGMNAELTGVAEKEEEEEIDEEEFEEVDEENGPDTRRGGTFLKLATGEVIDLTKLSREERKRVVKEAQRDKRKNKVPKAVKKALKKKAQKGKK